MGDLLIDEVRRFDKCLANWREGFFNLLVVRMVGLGDVMSCVVVTRALKRKYPESVITFYTSSSIEDFLKRFNWLYDVVSDGYEELSRIEDQYDLTVDLRGVIDYLPWCDKAPRIDLFARRLGVELEMEDYKFRFEASAEEKQFARDVFEDKGRGKRKMILSSNAQAEIRTWDLTLDFADVVSETFDVYLVHSKSVGFESEGVYDLGGLTTVGQLCGLVSESDVLVTPDTGVMHLAGWMGKPFVSVFGPIPPQFRVGHFDKHIDLWRGDLECAPCWDWQKCACDIDKRFKAKTDIGHHWDNGFLIERVYKHCMKGITVEMVQEAVESLLGQG